MENQRLTQCCARVLRVCAVAVVVSALALSRVDGQATTPFQILDATIDDVHEALRSKRLTCRPRYRLSSVVAYSFMHRVRNKARWAS